jgi:prepilin-type processing-associated H-X9-DG protein
MTIVELLAVVGILALLLGLLLPALSSIKMAARRNTEVSGARQMMTAYFAYANSNRDRVLPGYKTGLAAVDESGTSIAGMPQAGSIAAARYPWRLLPYLDFNVYSLYLNGQQEMIEQAKAEGSHTDYVYTVSLWPSLGLNTRFVGGHGYLAWIEDGDSNLPNYYEQTYGRWYIEAVDEAPKPQDLIVFASARGSDTADVTGPIFEGYWEITAPYFTAAQGYQWAEEYRRNLPPSLFGFLSPRYGGEAVVAFMDGHVAGMNDEELKDMRHWARDADAADWGLEEQD